RRHTRSKRDWSSDVCSSDLAHSDTPGRQETTARARTGFRVAKQGIAAFLPTSVHRRRHPEKTPVARCDGTGGRDRPTPWGEEERSEERRVGNGEKQRWEQDE